MGEDDLLKRLMRWFKHDYEPTVLRSWWTALLAIAANVGITLSTDVQGEVSFWIGVASVVLTQVQAILTRKKVWSPDSVRKEVQAAEERGRASALPPRKKS